MFDPNGEGPGDGPRGSGGLERTDHRRRRDVKGLRLVARALKERWAIPTHLRTAVIDRLAAVIADPEASPREITVAARTLVFASQVNLHSLALVIKADEHSGMAERLDQLEALADREGAT
jgi:hypothetical protein